MALQPYRECGEEVSTEAEACPHCGAVNRNGSAAPRSRPIDPVDPRRPAHHEAGHAVAREVLGLPIIFVSLYRDPEDGERTGRLHGWSPPDPDGDQIRCKIVSRLAGLAAEEQYMGVSDSAWGNAARDYGDAHRMLMDRGLDSEERRERIDVLEEEARRLMDENWPAVEAVAEALLESRPLEGEPLRAIDGDLVAELVAGASGGAEEDAGS